MKAPLLAVTLLSFALPAGLFAQAGAQDSYPFKINYAANLQVGDSALDFTNSGASGGNICVNLYVFSPDEEEQTCCSCTLSPNSLWSATLVAPGLNGTPGLLENTLTLDNNYLAHFHSAVVKALATTGNCAANNAAIITGNTPLAAGLLAWGSHYHITATGAGAITETEFATSTLSATEFGRMVNFCNFALQNGSGAGICAGCALGGLVQTSSLTPKLAAANKGL